MRNIEKWVATKARMDQGVLKPNLPAIYGGSYHTIKLQLQVYQRTLTRFASGELADLGCGAVPYFECYRDLVKSVTCADRFENQFTDATIDLNSRFSFKPDSFDTVLFSDVVNHVYAVDNLFSESGRILRKNGKLIIFTPFLYWISEAPNDYHRLTKFALERKCLEHGFEVLELSSYGTWRDVMLDLLFKRFHDRFSFRILKTVSDVFFRKCVIDAGFEPFPLGYTIVAQKK